MPRDKGDAMKWDGIKLTKVRLPKSPSKRKRVITVSFELHDYHSPEFPDGGFLNLYGVKSDLLEAMDYMDVEVKKLKIRRVKA